MEVAFSEIVQFVIVAAEPGAQGIPAPISLPLFPVMMQFSIVGDPLQ